MTRAGNSCIPHAPWQFSLSVSCRDVKTSPATPSPGSNRPNAKGTSPSWIFGQVRSTGTLPGPKSCFPVFPQHGCPLFPAFPSSVEQSQTSGTVGNQEGPSPNSPSSTPALLCLQPKPGRTRKNKKAVWEGLSLESRVRALTLLTSELSVGGSQPRGWGSILDIYLHIKI